MTSETTRRLYSGALDNWARWLAARGIPDPAETMSNPPAQLVADYLKSLRRGGVTRLPVHLSAIASLVRKCGGSFDTRQIAIQSVMQPVRRTIAARRRG